MRIIKVDINKGDAVGNGVHLTFDNGQEITLSFADAGIIKTRLMLEELKENIHDILLEEIDNGYIDMDKYEWTQEEFEDEIYTDLADEIEYGNYVSEEYIRERITDTAHFYEMDTE